MALETTLKAKTLDLVGNSTFTDTNYISQALTDGYKDVVDKVAGLLPQKLPLFSSTVTDTVVVSGSEYGLLMNGGVNNHSKVDVLYNHTNSQFSINGGGAHGLSIGDQIILSNFGENTNLNGLVDTVASASFSSTVFTLTNVSGGSSETATGGNFLRLGQTGYGPILHASRQASDNNYYDAKVIPPTKRREALDSTSMHYSSEYTPSYYIMDQKLRFAPSLASDTNVEISVIPWIEVDSASSSLGAVPFEFERLVCMYAAMKILLRKNGNLIDSLVQELSSNIINGQQWEPDIENNLSMSFNDIINQIADEDAELADAVAKKMQMEVQQHGSNVGKSNIHMQFHKVHIDKVLTRDTNKYKWNLQQYNLLLTEYNSYFANSPSVRAATMKMNQDNQEQRRDNN